MSRSRLSAAPQPEFFFDRCLGKVVANGLRERGWIIHLIADTYPDDAQQVEDVAWMREGIHRGWALLTKDTAIRRRPDEWSAAAGGHLFMLSNGNLTAATMINQIHGHRPQIDRHIRRSPAGIYVLTPTGIRVHDS